MELTTWIISPTSIAALLMGARNLIAIRMPGYYALGTVSRSIQSNEQDLFTLCVDTTFIRSLVGVFNRILSVLETQKISAL